MTQLHQVFLGLGDPVGLAQVKTAAQFHRMMMAEATVSAYQDIFMLSGFISLFNVVPALLRQRQQQEEVTTSSTPPTLTSKPIQQDSSAR